MILSKEKIDCLRADRGMTIHDIAAAGKTSSRTVVAALAGKSVSVLAAGRIAKALGVSVESLAVRSDEH